MVMVERDARARTRADGSPWPTVLRSAAAMAAAMGIGRFAYTPILPLMHAQAGLSAQYGSALATANYIGYLIGALAGIGIPRLLRSALAARSALVVLLGTLVAMAATESHTAWFWLRLAAGVASAFVFMFAVTALQTRLREHPQHLAGWGFGGVGAGIALSGVVVLAVRSVPATQWRIAWVASAAVALVLTVVCWPLRAQPAETAGPAGSAGDAGDAGDARAARDARETGAAPEGVPPTRRWFASLLVSYTLEGIGYIIAGTFLVAAVSQHSPAAAGSTAWILVGVAAFPAAAVWGRLSQRWSRPSLLLAALAIQAVGIALPAVAGGVAPALISAVLFGGTFLGAVSLALAVGTHLQFPRAVALLTTGYSVGQILGPVLVTPLLRGGYRAPLLAGAVIVLAAALAATALRIRFPHHVGMMVEPARAARLARRAPAGKR